MRSCVFMAIRNIHLFVFSVHNVLFGVWAAQVEELLEHPIVNEQGEVPPESTISYKGQDLRVINFSSQIDARRSNVVPEDEKYVDRDLASPKILVIKRRDGSYAGIRVANLEDLATISIEQVHALPLIMQKIRRIQGLWGLALVQDRPVMLIDLAQL